MEWIIKPGLTRPNPLQWDPNDAAPGPDPNFMPQLRIPGKTAGEFMVVGCWCVEKGFFRK